MTYTDSADDDQSWTAQDERDNPPAPPPPPEEDTGPEPLWKRFAREQLGYGAPPPDPGTEPLPPDSHPLYQQFADKYLGASEPATPDSSGQRTPLYQQWAEKHLGPIKDAIASYLGGDNAAPPHEVDAAMAATQAANPDASTADVVQKTIAGTADPLSPNYMDQAGQDALGGLGRRDQAGGTSDQTGYAQSTYPGPDQARARGENPLYDTPANMAVGRPLYDVDDIQRGTPLNMPRPSSRSTPARAAPRTYIGPQGEERTGPNRAVGRRSDAGDDTGAPGPQYVMADTGTMSDASNDVRSNAGQSDIIRIGPTVDFLGNPIPSGSAREFGPYMADQSRVSPDSIRVGPQQQATGYARSTYTGPQGEERTGQNTLVAQGTPVDDPVMQERLADLQQRIQAQTGLSNTEAARLAYDTAERDPSQLTPRYENPPAPRQSTAYANQPPSAAGFSGSAGNNVTTIPVRQGAPTPAGAAAPQVTSAANPTYPQGYKLVPATPAQGTVSNYDRAVVGPDGKVVSYVRKGEAPPSPDKLMNKVYSDNLNDNMQEFYRRLRAGEPTGIDLNQYKRGNYDLSQPLPPRSAPTAQSMADRDEAVRQNIIRPSSQMQQGGGGGDPVQDLLQRAAQTRDVNAQRMFTNEAYKIQETRRVNQQKSADAALKTFSTGEQNLIKSIYTKENAGNKLTPAEQALKDDYVTRIQQHSRSQSQAGGQATTGGPVRVNSMADAARLPRGTQFLDPNGNLRTVP